MGVRGGAEEQPASQQPPAPPVHDAFSGWLTEPAREPEPPAPPPSYQPRFTPPPVQDAGRRNLPRRERSARPLSDEGHSGVGDQPPGSPAAVDGTRPWWAPPGSAAGAATGAAPSHGSAQPELPRRATYPGPTGSVMPFSLPGESGPSDPSFDLFSAPSDGRSAEHSRPAARAPEPAFPAPAPQVPVPPMPLDAGPGNSPLIDPSRGPGGPLPRRQPIGGQPSRAPQPSGLSELTPPPGYPRPDDVQPAAYQPSAFEPSAFEPSAYQPAAFEPSGYEPPSPLPSRTPSPQAPAPQLPPRSPDPIPPPAAFPPAPSFPAMPAPMPAAPPVLPPSVPGLPQRTRPEDRGGDRDREDVYRDPTPSNALRELEDPPPATFAEVLNPTGKRKPLRGGYKPPRRPSNRPAAAAAGRTPFPDAAAAATGAAGAAAGAAAAGAAGTGAAAAGAGAAAAAAAGAAGAAASGAGAGTGLAAGAGLAAVQAAAAARIAAGAAAGDSHDTRKSGDSREPDDGSTHIMPATTRRSRSQATGRRGESAAETTGERKRSRHTGEQPRLPEPPRRRAEPDQDGYLPDELAPAAEESHGRAGRNLPAAITVGVVLAGLTLASLFTRPEAFVALASLVVVLAVWELAGAMAAKQITVPVIPLAVGSLGMLVSAYVAGEEGLLVSFALTGFGVLLWRIIDGVPGAARDVTAGLFTAAYIPLLAGFAILLLADPHGPQRVVVFILVTVASDIGGYAAGVMAGRTPMAPTISPKKSWEGFAGSVVTCLIVGVVCMFTVLDGPWWAGLAIGAAAAVTATVGDLSESLIKRDLGVKDMGSLLPGHGGIMDRLDSLLPTAPVVFLLLHYLVK